MLESLHTIKSDLERTALHMERLSLAMAGHLVFLAQRGGHIDGLDVQEHIDAIDSSIKALRTAAATIDKPSPAVQACAVSTRLRKTALARGA